MNRDNAILTYASIGIYVDHLSDDIIIEWSWIVYRNDPKIAKLAIGSQYNKVDPRVATAVTVVWEVEGYSWRCILVSLIL